MPLLTAPNGLRPAAFVPVTKQGSIRSVPVHRLADTSANFCICRRHGRSRSNFLVAYSALQPRSCSRRARHGASIAFGAWLEAGRAGLPLLSALLLLLSSASCAAQEMLLGPARVVDGDTLEVAGTKIRLYGVDAPETKQTCKDARGAEYACGEAAMRTLKERVGSGNVACSVKSKDMYGRSVADCAAVGADGLVDLGEYMVANGQALAYRQYSKEYVPDEDAARSARRGVWAGQFEVPWEWRKDHRRGSHAEARAPGAVPSGGPRSGALTIAAAAPKSLPSQLQHAPGCDIKGNISGKGRKLYHSPSSSHYDAVKIDPTSGERWFCSETEAAAAGWDAAK